MRYPYLALQQQRTPTYIKKIQNILQKYTTKNSKMRSKKNNDLFVTSFIIICGSIDC